MVANNGLGLCPQSHFGQKFLFRFLLLLLLASIAPAASKNKKRTDKEKCMGAKGEDYEEILALGAEYQDTGDFHQAVACFEVRNGKRLCAPAVRPGKHACVHARMHTC
jgi:hypothetical protein